MYRITAFNGTNEIPIYDPLLGALPVHTNRWSGQLNQPGSLEFTLTAAHSAFEELAPFKTFVSLEKNGTEVFYGRVLTISPSIFTGEESVTCEGALSFLNDGDLAADPRNSQGAYTHQTMTAEEFFRRCIDAHNAEVNNDPRRKFTVGIVDHSRSEEEKEYTITSFSKVREALDTHLLNDYGGFLRVRSDGNGGHLIDWVESYGRQNTSLVELGENVISQTNQISGENMFTAIRPVGQNGLVHSITPILDVYSPEEMAEYGRIVKTVEFPNITTEAALLERGQALVERINKTLYLSSEIGVLDLHFLDDEIPEIEIGDSFTNIVGLEGEELIIDAQNCDIDNPQNDTISLKNAKHLEGDGIDEFRNDGNTLSKRSARSSGGVGMALKYYHELDNEARITVDKLNIATQTLGIHADLIEQTANNVIELSHAASALYRTGVIQNSEAITTVAGQFDVVFDPAASLFRVTLVEGSKLQVQEDGVFSDVIGQKGLSSAVSQTASQIRSEVRNSISNVYTAINQTASSIRFEISQKANVFYQYSDPALDPGKTISDNDIWIQHNKMDTIGDMEQFTLGELGQYDIKEFYGALVYVRDNGVWKLATDEQRAAIDWAENELTREKVRFARGDLDTLFSEFTIEKGQIRSHVEDVRNGLASSITQTAGQIRSEVSNSVTGLQSSITQTASQIRTEVSNSISQLQSSITQEADRISLVVQGTGSNAKIKPASIVAAINSQTGQSIIRLSADMIALDGSTTIADVIEAIPNEGVGMGTAEIEDLTLTHSLWIDQFGVKVYGSEGDSFYMDDIVVDASASGNVLTLHTLGGDTITFSKATTLSSSWSGSNSARILTMTAKQNNTTVATRTVGFGTALGTHDLDLTVDSNGTPTAVTPTGGVVSIDCPVKIAQLVSSGSTTYYTKNVRFNPNSLLQAKTASANGTVTPDSGYIGLSKVTVNVASSVTSITATSVDPSYSTESNGNNITITLNDGTTRLQAITLTKGSWSEGHIAVNSYLGTSSGTRFNRVWITIPNASTMSNNANYNTNDSNLVGTIKKSTVTANAYLYWTVGGKKFHIVVNA